MTRVLGDDLVHIPTLRAVMVFPPPTPVLPILPPSWRHLQDVKHDPHLIYSEPDVRQEAKQQGFPLGPFLYEAIFLGMSYLGC